MEDKHEKPEEELKKNDQKKKKERGKHKKRGKHTGKLLPDMRQINCYCLTLRSALGF